MKITQVKSANGDRTSRSATRCARSACAASARPSSATDSPQLRGMVHRVRHLIKVEEK